MKRLSLALVMILMAFGVSYAQKPIKGSYNKAQSYLDKGEIAEAKKYIDAAEADEKLSGKSKTWLVKGFVYQAIALSDDEAISGLAPDALQQAVAAYDKVKEMEGESSALVKQLTDPRVDANFQMKPSIIEEFRNAYYEKGAAFYQEEAYEDAMKAFQKCRVIMEADTAATLAALTCAQMAEVDSGVTDLVKALKDMNYHDASLYIEWARYEYRKAAALEGDESKKAWQKVIDIADEGIVKNPTNVVLVKFKTDAYIRLDRKEDAVASLQKSIDADPDDKIAHFSLGTLQDELGNYAAAEKSFQKAVELDPEFFNAYFNYFVMYNNQVRDKVEEVQNLVDSRGSYTDPEKGEQLEKEIKELRTKSLEILKKAQKIEPDNATVKENIEFLENQLKK